jgi:alpha-mannosidase
MLIRKITQRIEQYLSFLDEKKYISDTELVVFVYQSPELSNKIPNEVKKEKINFPFQYGLEKNNYWFFTTVSLSEKLRNEELYIYAPTGADSLVFIDGKPAGAVNPFHHKIKILDREKKSDKIEIVIEAYAGHIIPGYHPMHKPRIMLTLSEQKTSYPIIFPTCALIIKNKPIYELYYDILVLYDIAQELDKNSLRKNIILRELYYNLIKIHFVSDQDRLNKEVTQALHGIKKLFLQTNGPSVPKIYSVGHAHIDHAWLWPISETIRKAARTFSNMARLAEEFTDFVFIQSQPAQLELVKKFYPDVFSLVLEAYKRGQWEPNGGMWVEADTNIPNAESLIRQFLYGKESTVKNFNYIGDTLWLPDVFGYSANLPQILKGCGITYFVTSKISWNDTTRFPFDTFIWSGIDGSSVKAHFLTTGYEGFLSINRILKAWNNVQHKEVQDSLLQPIGEGDGGGGNTRSDMEVMKRIGNLEGAPITKWSKVSNALVEIFANTHNLPIWQGELYLELHRGTYTTIANNKKYNRKLEQKFRNIEFLSVLCSPDVRKALGQTIGLEYNHEKLNNLWREFLTLQFHDIIPGSSINKVNTETLETYQSIESNLIQLENELLNFYFQSDNIELAKSKLSSINSLSWSRLILIQLQDNYESNKYSCKDYQGTLHPIQTYKDFSDKEISMTLISLPPLGMSESTIVEEFSNAKNPFLLKDNTLTTPYYKINFSKNMEILSLTLIDDEFNYVAKENYFNTLQLAEDFPVTWDAWDIEWDAYEHKIKTLEPTNKPEVLSEGQLFFHIRKTFSFSQSDLIQDIIFYAHNNRIDFITKVNWKESHKVLRTIFSSTIFSNSVKCEIQNGFIERSTLKNRDHEKAMFEMVAHKWISLDDGHRGIALLNDSKFGHHVTRNQLGLTLLRSPKHPDEFADIGDHEFIYSLVPYREMPITTIIHKGYELNNNPIIFLGKSSKNISNYSLFTLTNQKIIVECIKKAELDESIVLRLYESSGASNSCDLLFTIDIKECHEATMLEEKIKTIPVIELNTIKLNFKPFETKSLLFQLK